MTCPTCSACANESETITNVATREQFCFNCASQVCPSFLSHYILDHRELRISSSPAALSLNSEVGGGFTGSFLPVFVFKL